MKPNRFKQAIAEGRVPLGHMIMEFGTRGMAQILAPLELDFVIIDTEHSGFTVAEVADQVAWFKATEIAPFVRIPQIHYHFMARTLDAGALGIMVPNVKSGTEARAIVQAVKYKPLGDRGVILGNANTAYQSVEPPEFLAYANDNTTIICQIESQAGLDNLGEIAATPGVDVLWVGHFDLTQSLGIPGQFQHPQFLAALEQVVETANRHGLRAGLQPGSLEQAQQWLEMGFDVISFGSDFAVYRQAMTNALTAVRGLSER